MKTNVKSKSIAFTHEGAPAKNINAVAQLKRSVLSCFLFENEFYEDGQEISKRIAELCDEVPVTIIAELAIYAREKANLRHVPLWLLIQLIRRGSGSGAVSDTIARVIQRADELAELTSLYWKNGKRPLSAQMKKGLAKAMLKFNEYQFAKYNRDASIKPRDVMFMVHPKPQDEALFKKLADNTLEIPDTWEVQLSGGADKKATFERLISEGKLGYLALLRNLRNMIKAGCDEKLVSDAIIARKGGAQRVLPFRYIAAARACPQLEPAIDKALLEVIKEIEPLPGKTIVLVDVSGSMDYQMSGKSDLKRIDAAAALASIIPGNIRVFTFSNELKEVPPRKGMAGVDAITKSQPHGGTYLGKAVQQINTMDHDRLIVITDEQSHDRVFDPVAKHAYLINVASNRNGVGYGRWVHIDGFSESVLRFIAEYENVE